MTDFAVTTLMYHYVRAPGDRAEAGSGIPGLPPERFAAQLDSFAQNYTMIAWPDLLAYLLGQSALPPNACLLTFDDGTCDHYINVFPSLRERGLSGLFFALARRPGDGLVLGHKIHFLLARLGVGGLRAAIWERLAPEQRLAYTQAEAHYQARGERSAVELLKSVLQRNLSIPADGILSDLFAEHIGDEAGMAGEYYLTDQQIAEMRAGGMHFGGHSRSHPWFDWISVQQQADEIMASAAWLGTLAPGPFAFAYPYGGYNADSAQLLGAHGFAAAFTTIRHVEQRDPFFIGRFDGEALIDDRLPTTAWAGERVKG
jgi:peptidoglycan/xylan/chitin deacetylase (PgdA/CDA1 family)